MEGHLIAATRRALHGVAELVIAGPQHRANGTIRMRILPGGFGAVATPLRVDGAELVWDSGRAPLSGSCRDLAAAAGVDAGVPAGIYDDTSGVDPDEPLTVDVAAALLLEDWLERGDAALRAFAPEAEPVLWPEHFDLAITLDEVNYGISPGDAAHPVPYAYVGPWTPREGPFWNAPFGALRRIDQLRDADSVAAFLSTGRSLARG